MKIWKKGGGHILESCYPVGKSTYADQNVWSYDGRGGEGQEIDKKYTRHGQNIDKTQTRHRQDIDKTQIRDIQYTKKTQTRHRKDLYKTYKAQTTHRQHTDNKKCYIIQSIRLDFFPSFRLTEHILINNKNATYAPMDDDRPCFFTLFSSFSCSFFPFFTFSFYHIFSEPGSLL